MNNISEHSGRDAAHREDLKQLTITGLDIKFARLRCGLTQQQLAEEMGISRDFISKIECNGRKATDTRLRIYAHLSTQLACEQGDGFIERAVGE